MDNVSTNRRVHHLKPNELCRMKLGGTAHRQGPPSGQSYHAPPNSTAQPTSSSSSHSQTFAHASSVTNCLSKRLLFVVVNRRREREREETQLNPAIHPILISATPTRPVFTTSQPHSITQTLTPVCSAASDGKALINSGFLSLPHVRAVFMRPTPKISKTPSSAHDLRFSVLAP